MKGILSSQSLAPSPNTRMTSLVSTMAGLVKGAVIDLPKATWHHIRQGTLNYPMTAYIVFMHYLAFCGLLRIPSCQPETLLFAFLLWPLSGLGITAGAHRLWAHRSYEAHFVVRLFLMLCNSIANQLSIFHWVRDHRVHHECSETAGDPHNATRGFFFSHVGWLITSKDPAVVAAGKKMDFEDLMADPLVRFQRLVYMPWAHYWCLMFPAQVASRCWGEEYYNGLLVAGALRFVWVLHCTFLVNSAAHWYGDHPYQSGVKNGSPAENPIVSWFAIGEGWHNWHHKYPYDYATSEFGIMSQYNPTKLFIDCMAALGLVWNCKRANNHWELARQRRDREAKEAPNKKPAMYREEEKKEDETSKKMS